MSNYVTIKTLYTDKELTGAYTTNYNNLRKSLGLSVMARTINNYKVVENLKVDEAKEFFADSELLHPFLCTKRGQEFLQTSEGLKYLGTEEGMKYREKYGYDVSGCTGCSFSFKPFNRCCDKYEEDSRDYEIFRILWEPMSSNVNKCECKHMA